MYLYLGIAGFYTFYMANSYYGYLYASTEAVGVNEITIAECTVRPAGGDYYKESNGEKKCISEPIPMQKGEKLYLRVRVNNYQGFDWVTLAVKITPAYNTNNKLVTGTWSPPSGVHNETDLIRFLTPVYNSSVTDEDKLVTKAQREENFHDNVLQHNAVREEVIVSLQMEYTREVQMINITGADSGGFQLVVQQEQLSDYFDISSSAGTIDAELERITRKISNTETRWFSVWIETVNTFDRVIYIKFHTNTPSPLTLIEFIDIDLLSSNPNVQPYGEVSVYQYHTPIPSGSFSIGMNNSAVALTEPISWSAGADTVESVIEESWGSDYNVSYCVHTESCTSIMCWSSNLISLSVYCCRSTSHAVAMHIPGTHIQSHL